MDPMVTVAAKMVGRWPNGTPLLISPETDNPPIPVEKGEDGKEDEDAECKEERRRAKLTPEQLKAEDDAAAKKLADHLEKMHDFDEYAYQKDDPHGLRVPLGAHIRRANPRNSLVADPVQSMKIVKHHRMLRRGRAYGPPLADSMLPRDLLNASEEKAKEERGLHFMCFNADIAGQFEFVQQMWLDSSKFHGLREENPGPRKNPGQPEQGVITLPQKPAPVRLPGFSTFITVKGGAYFFMPSIRAVNYLAGKFAQPPVKQATAVFSGGGVKALAFAGALEEAESRGIVWRGFAGTSGGAIVAALLAAKYSAHEIFDYMSGHMPPLKDQAGNPAPDPGDHFQPQSIAKRRALFGLPVLSPVINAVAHMGMYDSYELERTMKRMLHERGIDTWADLRCTEEEKKELGTDYRLQLIATDLTNRRAVLLPQDLHQYDLDPDSQSVAWCVRMSMSIPGFFEPVVLPYTKPKIVLVDGGLISSFPVWVFKQDATSSWPTIGFFLNEGADKPHRIHGLGSLAWGALNSGWSAMDKLLADRYAEGRTLSIDVKGIPTINRSMTEDQRKDLRALGLKAAGPFFSKLGALPGEAE
jgi:NTE family protein